MKEIQKYLMIILVLLMMSTVSYGEKLSSPYLSGAIVVTMFSLLLNKLIYEFRSIK
jgi:hypothetical protein